MKIRTDKNGKMHVTGGKIRKRGTRVIVKPPCNSMQYNHLLHNIVQEPHGVRRRHMRIFLLSESFCLTLAACSAEPSASWREQLDAASSADTAAVATDAPVVTDAGMPLEPMTIVLEGDSWMKGPAPSGPGTQAVGNGPRGYLAALLAADIANGDLPAGLVLKYGGYAESGAGEWTHHDAVGGTRTADHILGGLNGAKAFADYYGEGKPGGTDVGVWVQAVGHNDGLDTYKDPKTGEVALVLTEHKVLPASVVVSCSAPGRATGSGTFDLMQAYNVSEGWPAMRAAGVDLVTCDNPGATLTTADLAPDGHPNDSGDQKIAAAMHPAVLEGIRHELARR